MSALLSSSYFKLVCPFTLYNALILNCDICIVVKAIVIEFASKDYKLTDYLAVRLLSTKYLLHSQVFPFISINSHTHEALRMYVCIFNI